MAGLKGNVAWWTLAKQGSKGTAASFPSGESLIPFSGGSIQPTRETANLAETDSTRDQGVSYVVRTGAEGSPEAYARDAYAHTLFEAVLGSKSSTAGPTNYVHTITPANALSYYTIWHNVGDTLYEKFTDCMVSELTFRAEAGGPATISTSVMGRTPERLASTPVTTETIVNDPVYNYNQAAVTLGSSTNLISSFELSINNNVAMQQTDDVVPYDMVPGQREVTLSFDLIFETLDEYNKFHYGSASGTTVSSSIATTNATFTLTQGTNNEIAFTIPTLAYEAFPVEPNPNGDPIVVSVRAQAQRPNTGSIVTATVKNQKAS